MEYLSVFEKAVLYIENYLSENITVNDVTQETGYSYYHLTSLFQSAFGENVGNYIKKRLLSNAGKQLIF
jgi:AraC family transcriptional regulator